MKKGLFSCPRLSSCTEIVKALRKKGFLIVPPMIIWLSPERLRAPLNLYLYDHETFICGFHLVLTTSDPANCYLTFSYKTLMMSDGW